MANPYHDETGRFCSKGEMGEAVERVYKAMVSTSAGPAQEAAADAWFNLRNEFEAAKKAEERPDALNFGSQSAPVRKASSDKLAQAQASLPDRSADRFARYTLPKGAMGFGSQEERYAQVVSTTAIHVLIDSAIHTQSAHDQYAGVTSYAPAKNVQATLATALTTFSEESGQAALQLSLARTRSILDRHTRTHALANGTIQDRIDVVPAIADLERKALTIDIDDPSGAEEDQRAPRGYGTLWAERAVNSFAQRTENLNFYTKPRGLDVFSTPATSHNQVRAQDVTREAIADVLNARSLVNPEYADYREVRRRLNIAFTERAKVDDSTHVSLDRVDAILKRESSVQELSPGKRVPYVDVIAALRALEQKGLGEDLDEPVPPTGADRSRAERSLQQREGIKALRAARRAAS